MKYVKPIPCDYPAPEGQNAFGAVRRHDIHTGVDLVCDVGTPVYAMEAGVVVNTFIFTGEKVGTPWWHETHGVLIQGNAGNILYGEIAINKLEVGDEVISGQCIGWVMQVLINDKGRPMSMLHLELYDHSYCGIGVVWKLGEEKPSELRDPTPILRLT